MYPNKHVAYVDILRNTRIGKASLELALIRLQYHGLLITQGNGRKITYKLDMFHPFIEGLQGFFQQERQMFQIIYPEILSVLSDFENDCLKEFKNIRDILLFGSYAKGNAHEKSDIDLYVIMDDYTPRDELRMTALEKKFSQRYEFQVFLIRKKDFEAKKKAKDSLIMNVLKEGVSLRLQ